ncbi:hypothetical protein LTR78_006573 [Recurvomyces mirabilis]|uniref:Major facilitator superfamily (MFS) profile domain-containing protein n=1 Tax=Recurvomyces mirabilis TaxID=574656 RepID=A0AAE0WL12_9PEZI|nr:hypothetical protein LTR78_006573 [Recurvomyces mirabilis]KAK5151010.1 hypothetical protein LTS14_009505 [Recurvomyces mirabilis]
MMKQPYFGLRGGWLTFWITGVNISEDYLDVLDLNGPSKTNLLSIITSIYNIGCFFGAILAFTVGERLGRKKTILLGTTIMAIGAILQVSAFSPAQMMVGRIVTGVGNGLNTATAPVWQTETSPSKWRGKLVVIEMMMNIFGFMLVNWINYGLSFVGGALAWRLPIGLQFVFMVVLWSTTPWLPESPRWLIAHDQIEKATRIIADIENKNIDDPEIVANTNEIIASVQYERQNAIGWVDLMRGKTGDAGTKTVGRLLLGAGTQFMQQFGGINVMSIYMPTLLITSVGLKSDMARLIAALSSVAYLVSSGVAAPLVERCGRRFMMMVSTAIQLVCFFMMAILLYYAQKPGYAHQKTAAEASVVWFFIYYMGFGLGMLGIPWLYPTEINNLSMRTKGAAVATATDWLTNFVIVQITPIGLQTLGWRFYIIFIVLNAAFLPVIWLLYPETADRTLEDLDYYYRENPPLIVIGDKDAISVKRPSEYVQMQDDDVLRARSVTQVNVVVQEEKE